MLKEELEQEYKNVREVYDEKQREIYNLFNKYNENNGFNNSGNIKTELKINSNGEVYVQIYDSPRGSSIEIRKTYELEQLINSLQTICDTLKNNDLASFKTLVNATDMANKL